MNTISKTQKKKIRKIIKGKETVGIVEYIQKHRTDIYIKLEDFIIDTVKGEIEYYVSQQDKDDNTNILDFVIDYIPDSNLIPELLGQMSDLNEIELVNSLNDIIEFCHYTDFDSVVNYCSEIVVNSNVEILEVYYKEIIRKYE